MCSHLGETGVVVAFCDILPNRFAFWKDCSSVLSMRFLKRLPFHSPNRPYNGPQLRHFVPRTWTHLQPSSHAPPRAVSKGDITQQNARVIATILKICELLEAGWITCDFAIKIPRSAERGDGWGAGSGRQAVSRCHRARGPHPPPPLLPPLPPPPRPQSVAFRTCEEAQQPRR